MKDNVKIEVYTDERNFFRYLIYNKIVYSNLEIKDNCYYLITEYENYKKIRRRYKCKIVRYYGKRNIRNFFSRNKYFMISLLWGLFLISILHNTIFDVNINTDNEKLYEILSESLKKNDIDKYKRKKSFEELNLIKEKILKENEDVLEWLEIKEIGCNYEVLITERVVGNKNNSGDRISHIVAKKDGLIKHITASKGDKLKSINDYVKKGEVIISGEIIKNEDTIKNRVRASGEVFAEVWYTVTISVPYEYTEYVETGEVINHYYLDIFGTKFTLAGKYESNNTMSEKKAIIDKPYLFFKLFKEEKKVYEYKKFTLNNQEAYDEAIKRAQAKIENQLNDKEYIISKKVLKKEEFSSKIVLEVFFKVYENIGETLEISMEEIKNEKDLD